MRSVSFLTTSLTLSRIRDLVLNVEQLIQELLSTREELNRYQQSDNIGENRGIDQNRYRGNS